MRLLALALALLACGPKPEPAPEPASEPAPAAAADVSGLYHVQRDARRCAAPHCGGWWLIAVNQPTTACPDGPAERCYAAPGPALVDGGLVQGTLRVGDPPTLEVARRWAPLGPGGVAELTQLADNGVRCVRAPCESIGAAVVGGEAVPVSDVDTTALPAHDPEGVGEAVVAGTLFAAGSVEARGETRVFVARELWLPQVP